MYTRLLGLGAILCMSCAPLWAQTRPCPPTGLSVDQSPSSGGADCFDESSDWLDRSSGSAVFYKNNFDYPNRNAYLEGAYSYHYPETASGIHKLDLETSIKLSGRGASRHNWIASEGANEAGPAWNYSFDGPGAKTVNTKKAEFYLQYSMYVDQGWVDFTYNDGDIKTQIVFNPAVAPFASGEIVQTRLGKGPWPNGFRVTNSAEGWQMMWSTPDFVNGDDTYYTFWDGGPQSDSGTTDRTDIDLFERRWGPRRRNLDRTDPDYGNVPQFAGGKWYTFEIYVNVRSPNSVVKIWFAEHGQSPHLLSGLIDAGLSENNDTYRGAHLISRAENTTKWISSDTFVVFDELIASDEPIRFPGGYDLPSPGVASPSNWPPSGARPR